MWRSTTGGLGEYQRGGKIITGGLRGRANWIRSSAWRANGASARIGWCGMRTGFSSWRRRVGTMRRRRQGGGVGKAGWADGDRVPGARGAMARDRRSGEAGDPAKQGPFNRESGQAEVGAAGGSSLAGGGAAAEGQQSVGAGSRQGAVVGLALRFALNARPAGSQGCAPGKAHEKNKNHKKGTLLMS